MPQNVFPFVRIWWRRAPHFSTFHFPTWLSLSKSKCVCVNKIYWTGRKYFVAGAGEKKLLNPDQKCLLTFPPLHRDGQDSPSLCTYDQHQVHNSTMAVRSVAIHGKNDLETSEGFICCGNFNYGHPAVRDCLTQLPSPLNYRLRSVNKKFPWTTTKDLTPDNEESYIWDCGEINDRFRNF